MWAAAVAFSLGFWAMTCAAVRARARPAGVLDVAQWQKWWPTNVSVDFPLYHGSARSLKRTVFAAAAGRLGEDGQHRTVVQALRNISFTLRSGDRLGLIGTNGAGKTTLLRTLAGIYEPVRGARDGGRQLERVAGYATRDESRT